jgi:hypothetical protein
MTHTEEFQGIDVTDATSRGREYVKAMGGQVLSVMYNGVTENYLQVLITITWESK